MARFAARAVVLGWLAGGALAGQFGFAGPGPAQAGPRPAKKDVPYLIQADSLVETERSVAARRDSAGAAREEVTIYTIAGERSGARTPLASPALLVEAEGLDAERLRLFRLEVRKGRREIEFHSGGRGGAAPLRTEVTPVGGGIYRIEVVESLAPGEYALSPDGTNDVYCFAVF